MATATGPMRTEADGTPIPDDDILYEVIDGQIVEKTMGTSEAEIASILDQILGAFARTNRLGKVVAEMLFQLAPGNQQRRRPDVAFIAHERWPWNRRAPIGASWPIVPDLMIEVVSPSNSAIGINKKRNEYFRAGARQVWVVYPEERELHVYDAPKTSRILGPGDELDGGPLLPGFRLPVASLFDDEPEVPAQQGVLGP